MGSVGKCHYKLCCFCIPLRIGLLVWGYFNVIVCLLSICAIELMTREVDLDDEGVVRYPIYAIIFLNFGFHVAFIIGAHKKQAILLKVYFYYGLVNVGIAAGVFVLFLLVVIYFWSEVDALVWSIPIGVFPAILINAYFLTLVKYEVWKINNKHRELDKVVYTERIENENVEEEAHKMESEH